MNLLRCLCFSGLLLAGLSCRGAEGDWGGNLVKNGSFTQGSGTVASNWNPGFFDGAKGSVEWKKDSEGNGTLNFSFAENAKGVIQAENSLIALPQDGPRKLRLSVRYRGGGMMQIRFFQLNEKKEMVLRRTAAGAGIKLDHVLPKSTDWRSVTREWTLSKELLAEKTYAGVVIMYWPGSQKLSVSSVSLQLKGRELPKKEVRREVKINPPPSRVSPPSAERIVPETPYRLQIDGRFLRKNGNIHYFLGTLCSEWTVNSLWLRGLLGYDYIAVHHGDGIRAVENPQKQVEIGFENRSYVFSYMTEVLRNGMLPQLCIAQSYEYSPLYPVWKKHPEIGEFFITGNHSMSLDMHSVTAGKLYKNTFENDRRYFGRIPLLAYEILREPGYTPTHERPLKAFSVFARAKYGILEKANAVWGTSFKNWDEVAPTHLKELKLAMDWSARLAVLNHIYSSRPGNYYDWLEFLRGDFASGAAKVKTLLRKNFGDAPFTYDSRMQSHYFDGYAAVDPELAAQVNDIYFCHTGYRFFYYGGRPADSSSVLLSILDSVLYHDFLSHNINRPILNTENIVTTVAASGSSAKAMEENCFGKFHGMAKFQLVSARDKIPAEWFSVNFDDSSWKTIPVPGAWDETPEFKGKKGWGCYRFKFFMPSGVVRQSFLDSTVRYLIHGKGVAQKGEFWLNGKKIGTVAGWDTKYQFDVGGLLNYGKENILTVVVDGTRFYSEGLRSYLYLLSDRMISENKPFGEENYRQMFWSNVFHGVSGNTVWHWDSNVHYFMPEVKAEIEAGAPLALASAGPGGKAAILYPFESFRGMLNSSAQNYRDYMSYFGAMLFSGFPTDTLSCRSLAKQKDDRYSLIVLPYASLVRKGVWEKVEAMVRKGATAVVTFDSLIWSDDGYRRLPVEQFAGIRPVAGSVPAGWKLRLNGREFPLEKGDYCGRHGEKIALDGAEAIGSYSDGSPAVTVKKVGAGRICYVAARLDLFAASSLISKLGSEAGLSRPVEVVCGENGEFPYLETKLAGTPDRFLLYLTNWGGTTRKVTVKVADKAFLRHPLRMRNLKEWVRGGKRALDGAEKNLKEGMSVTLESQSPVVLLFERADQPPMKISVPSEKRLKLLDDVKSLAKNPTDSAAERKVLFLTALDSEDKDFGIDYFPVLSQMLRQQGFAPISLSPRQLTPEKLRECAMVVLAEECALIYNRLVNSGFPAMLKNYIKEGGSLLLLCSSNPYRPNSNRSILLSRILSPEFKIVQESICENPRSCEFGDPLQIRATDLTDHPLNSNVKSLQFFVTSAFRLNGPGWRAVVRSAPDDLRQKSQPVVAAGEFGKGRVVVAGDSLWLAPVRVESDDNLQFLQNVIDWLGHRPLSLCDRDAFLRKLPVSGARIRETMKNDSPTLSERKD